MADYQLTTPDANGPVIRAVDQASIPNDPANRDWQDYQTWLDQGHLPDPYIPPPEPPPPPPTQEQQDTVLYDHENRIRAIEGLPPMTSSEFKAKTTRA